MTAKVLLSVSTQFNGCKHANHCVFTGIVARRVPRQGLCFHGFADWFGKSCPNMCVGLNRELGLDETCLYLHMLGPLLENGDE